MARRGSGGKEDFWEEVHSKRKKAGENLKAECSGKATIRAKVHLGGSRRVLMLSSAPQRGVWPSDRKKLMVAYIFCILLWGSSVEDTNNSSGNFGVQVCSFIVFVVVAVVFNPPCPIHLAFFLREPAGKFFLVFWFFSASTE